jgi:hypothetical protein
MASLIERQRSIQEDAIPYKFAYEDGGAVEKSTDRIAPSIVQRRLYRVNFRRECARADCRWSLLQDRLRGERYCRLAMRFGIVGRSGFGFRRSIPAALQTLQSGP